MPTFIKQAPLSPVLPADSKIIFTIENQAIVQNETNVKFIISVYTARTYIVPINSAVNLVATLKTTPNGAGVGIFDLAPVCSSYARPTQMGRNGITTQNPGQSSTFKETPFRDTTPHSIHQIDRYCTNKSNMFYVQCVIDVEYLNTATDRVEVDPAQRRNTSLWVYYNGVLTNTNPISTRPAGIFYSGYVLQDFEYTDGSGDYFIRGLSGSSEGGKFLSNMPTKGLNVTKDDYRTIAFFNCINYNVNYAETMPSEQGNGIFGMATQFYDDYGTLLYAEIVDNVPINGGKRNNTPDYDLSVQYMFFGAGLANYQGRGGVIPAGATSYSVFPTDGTGNAVSGSGSRAASSCKCYPCGHNLWKCSTSPTAPAPCIYSSLDDCNNNNPIPSGEGYTPTGRVYTFGIVPEDCRGFESVTLTWLNRLGAWDYYTFTKRSEINVKSKRKTYHQLDGTWNENLYRPDDYKGGKKVFDNVATTTMTLNTDYIDQEVAAWLEELYTSSEVYIVNKFSPLQPTPNFTSANYIHQYVEGVVVTSSSYKKKTRANDGLIKYDIKVEKSKSQIIQRA